MTVVHPVTDVKVALHEAAHATVAVALGIEVHEVSIKPMPARGSQNASLGHVSHTRHPDPHASDVNYMAFWMRSWLMVAAAGHVVEQLVWPDDLVSLEGDVAKMIEMLRYLNPRDKELCARRIRAVRCDAADFLSQPSAFKMCCDLAERLLIEREMSGSRFYGLYYRGRCSAIYPSDPTFRCDNQPHVIGAHTALGPLTDWPHRDIKAWGDRWYRRPRRGSMSTTQRNIAALNAGQELRPLPHHWEPVLDTVDDVDPVLNCWNKALATPYRGPDWIGHCT